jgi:hypothetical protein
MHTDRYIHAVGWIGRLTRNKEKVIRRALADKVAFRIEIGVVAVDALEKLIAALVGCFGVDVGFAG